MFCFFRAKNTHIKADENSRTDLIWYWMCFCLFGRLKICDRRREVCQFSNLCYLTLFSLYQEHLLMYCPQTTIHHNHRGCSSQWTNPVIVVKKDKSSNPSSSSGLLSGCTVRSHIYRAHVEWSCLGLQTYSWRWFDSRKWRGKYHIQPNFAPNCTTFLNSCLCWKKFHGLHHFFQWAWVKD